MNQQIETNKPENVKAKAVVQFNYNEAFSRNLGWFRPEDQKTLQ